VLRVGGGCDFERLGSSQGLYLLGGARGCQTRGSTPLGQLVLNISLRDIGPDSILAASNIVDDVDHCLRERTSLHLTEQAAGNRNFIMGTLAQVLRGEIAVPHDRPIVFSPFGLGILDLVVATRIFAQALEAGETIEIPAFYAGAGHRREMTA